MTKKLILVTSPPACGKTYVSKKLAEKLHHVVYLDKDTLICLSKQIFVVAGEEYNRSSEFFEKNIRNYEYDAIMALAMEALHYDDIVLINAPFTREVRDEAYLRHLRATLSECGAELVVVWVEVSEDVMRRRMLERGSDRDTWKIEHWSEYLQTVDMSVPVIPGDPAAKNPLILFKNNTEAEFEQSLRNTVRQIEEMSNTPAKHSDKKAKEKTIVPLAEHTAGHGNAKAKDKNKKKKGKK